MRFTIGTKRALERIEQGETPYAAAKAEGITLATIYNAQKRLREANPDVGAPKGAIAGAKKSTGTVANFTVSHEDLKLIAEAADIAGLSKAAFMRMACVNAAKDILTKTN